MIELIIDDERRPEPIQKKTKIRMSIFNGGFNLYDENGFCLINAGSIESSGQFGLGIDNGSSKGLIKGSTDESFNYTRLNFIIRKND